eukprot:6182738-Pyramimonas_sp.AAC.1
MAVAIVTMSSGDQAGNGEDERNGAPSAHECPSKRLPREPRSFSCVQTMGGGQGGNPQSSDRGSAPHADKKPRRSQEGKQAPF